ncbi:MAG TPA: maleylacetoacetate isomerase [Woeseiaceae bacterium]|nr:maleylacetoacetate isomerase [Woeseiaceae bacterium]
MAIRLYTYWRSSAAYRVRIALNLKGIDYEPVPVSLKPGDDQQRSDEYRAINPQMLVPFFDDGKVAIGQSMAILEYLEETWPAPSLLPGEEPLRSKVRAFCNAIACEIHPLNNLRVLKYLSEELDVAEEQKSVWYAHWVTEGFRACEHISVSYAHDGPYVFGKNVTLADALLIPQMYNARRFKIPLDEYPRLVAVADACSGLQAFIDAAPENQPDYA